jgi:glycosyltransferase involved in cell wall biosynthesis
VLQLHHLFGSVLFRETAWPFAAYVLAFEKMMPWAYRGVRTLTGSESSRQELLEKGFNPVSLAAEGVNVEDYQIASPPDRESHLMVYVGRVKRYKGLDVLLAALRRLLPEFPEARLVIAGTGDDVDRLKGLAQDQGLADRIEFPGFITHEEKVKLYHRATVAVNSSLKEGFGLTSIEANACGTPVVATRVPGLVDSVVDGETGFLVPFGDEGAFAEALRRIFRGEGTLMESKARAFAATQNWERAYVATRDALLAAWAEKQPNQVSV